MGLKEQLKICWEREWQEETNIKVKRKAKSKRHKGK